MTNQNQALELKSTNVRFQKIQMMITRTLLNGMRLIAPNAAKRFVKKNFFKPRPYRLSSREERWLQSAHRSSLLVNGKTIQIYTWGEGPAVLFVHGWNGRGVQFHSMYQPFLEAGFSILTYDGPGHGESDGETSSYFEFTDALRVLLKSPEGNSVRVIIAHSLGASATVNCLSKDEHDPQIVLIAPVMHVEDILFGALQRHGVPEILFKRLIRDYEREFGYDIRLDNPHQLMKTLKRKILIIHDRGDRAIPFEDSEKISRSHSWITLHSVEGQGHNRILRNEQVISFILDYLAKNIRQAP